MVNSAPPPGLPAADTSPPIAAVSSFTMASPSPEPTARSDR